MAHERADTIILPHYGKTPGSSAWRMRTYENFTAENKSPWPIYCYEHCFSHCKNSTWKALQSPCSRACLMLYMQPAALPWQAGKEWWPGWQLSHWSPATPERHRHLPRKSQTSGWVPAKLHSHTANEKRHFRCSICIGCLLSFFFKWKEKKSASRETFMKEQNNLAESNYWVQYQCCSTTLSLSPFRVWFIHAKWYDNFWK